MSEADREETIRRILVALDASPHSLAALQAAAELAANLDAEILGMFVEDVNLLRLADLPMAQEMAFFATRARSLSRQDVEKQLHTRARLARRALATIAEREDIRWSFVVSQGVIPRELLAAAMETDLIILGKSGWSGRRSLGSTARVIIAQAPRQAMILQRGKRLGLPVSVVYDGSPQAQRALQAAVQLLPSGDGYLTIMILAKSFEKARELQSEIAPWLRDRRIQARYRWLLEGNGEQLARLLRGERCGVTVLPADGEVLSQEELAKMLDRTECPILLVR